MDPTWIVRCRDCDSHTQSNWFFKAKSDADWHNTSTGHIAEVVNSTSDIVEYATEED